MYFNCFVFWFQDKRWNCLYKKWWIPSFPWSTQRVPNYAGHLSCTLAVIFRKNNKIVHSLFVSNMISSLGFLLCIAWIYMFILLDICPLYIFQILTIFSQEQPLHMTISIYMYVFVISKDHRLFESMQYYIFSCEFISNAL